MPHSFELISGDRTNETQRDGYFDMSMRTSQTRRQQAATLPAGSHPVRALEIAHRLQTTLGLQEIIELFDSELERDLYHDGLTYTCVDESMEIKVRHRAHHSAEYHLKVNGESLGQLTIMRRSRYSEDELNMLEELLTAVLYPIRNALMYQRALHSAYKDPLTGVSNRAALSEALLRETGRAQRQGHAFSLIMFDIDFFKSVNDTFGHDAGDAALRTVASTAESVLRSTDMLFRFGGEEFVILLTDTAQDGAMLLAERLREAVANATTTLPESSIQVTISAGVSEWTHGEAADATMKRADQALYKAKNNGRNQVVLS